MTKHIKMEPYTSKATLRLEQENRLENIKKKMRQKVYKARKQATNPVQKVKLLYEKESKKGLVFIQHDECDVDKQTKCYVYFDARYADPNMRYDDKTDSWFHYATPGLFRNATKVRFVDSINRWMPEQPHPNIIIL